MNLNTNEITHIRRLDPTPTNRLKMIKLINSLDYSAKVCHCYHPNFSYFNKK